MMFAEWVSISIAAFYSEVVCTGYSILEKTD